MQGGGLGYSTSLNVCCRDILSPDEDKQGYLAQREGSWDHQLKKGRKALSGKEAAGWAGIAKGPAASGRVCFPIGPTGPIHQREKEEMEPVCVCFGKMLS